MKIEYVLFPSVFSKLQIRVSEVILRCSHDPIFGTNKIASLKSDRINEPLWYQLPIQARITRYNFPTMLLVLL